MRCPNGPPHGEVHVGCRRAAQQRVESAELLTCQLFVRRRRASLNRLVSQIGRGHCGRVQLRSLRVVRLVGHSAEPVALRTAATPVTVCDWTGNNADAACARWIWSCSRSVCCLLRSTVLSWMPHTTLQIRPTIPPWLRTTAVGAASETRHAAGMRRGPPLAPLQDARCSPGSAPNARSNDSLGESSSPSPTGRWASCTHPATALRVRGARDFSGVGSITA